MKSHRLLRSDAARIWEAALRAADPETALLKNVRRKGRLLQIAGRRIDLSDFEGVWVLGAGKAAGPMGRAAEKILGPYLGGGLIVTKYGHSVPLKKIEVLEAGHPLPDSNSLAAAEKMISFAGSRIQPHDLVLALFSGGASSLLASPAPGISLADKQGCTELLLRGGADIHALNAVRKHLSSIKGGGLARILAPARCVCLIISDVVGDDIGTIGSGPLAPDDTTFADCIDVLQKLRLLDQVSPAVKKHLKLGAANRIPETPKKNEAVFKGVETHILAGNAQACSAASKAAKKLGYKSMVLTSRLEGDNEAAARFHMGVAEEIVFHARPMRPPSCVVSGGETTVKVVGSGNGGRNQEFVLHCVRQLAKLPAPCVVASLGTDGTDGPTEAAGAVADNTTLSRSIRFGAHFLDDCIRENDSYRFFGRLEDHIITGPTRTNVMDLHLIMVG